MRGTNYDDDDNDDDDDDDDDVDDDYDGWFPQEYNQTPFNTVTRTRKGPKSGPPLLPPPPPKKNVS